MVLEMVISSTAKATYNLVGLTRSLSNTSPDVIFRRTDLTTVQSSLEGLTSTFSNETNYLDYATERQLVRTLQTPIENWGTVAEKMAGLIERYEARRRNGQHFRPAVFLRAHRSEVDELRKKSEECKLSLLLAIAAAAASIQSTHFRTLYSGLCGIHNQLQANHEESRIWMEGLYRTIQGNHEELRGGFEVEHKQVKTIMQDSNRSRMENHSEAISATGEVGKKVQDLGVAVLVAETVTLMAIGVVWYFWRGSANGKHEEARGWIQESSRSRTKNHNEALNATKRVEKLVIGLIVTTATTMVTIAATGACCTSATAKGAPASSSASPSTSHGCGCCRCQSDGSCTRCTLTQTRPVAGMGGRGGEEGEML